MFYHTHACTHARTRARAYTHMPKQMAGTIGSDPRYSYNDIALFA